MIPVRDKAALLRQTLDSLARQRIAPGRFEVVVVDDASTDGTGEVGAEFAGGLRVRTHVQPERRFRSAARNAGACLASAPLLAFVDGGVTVGPDFVRSYVDAHAAAPGSAFIGYTPGYDLAGPRSGLAERLAAMPPEDVLASYEPDEPLRDMRHDQYAAAGFDLSRMHLPWALFWTVNVSVRHDDFDAVGGFHEGFRGWGVEDVEFGYRLAGAGVRIGLSRDAWAIDGPHERDMKANRRSGLVNTEIFWSRHRTVETEMYWAVYGRWHGVALSLEEEFGALVDWRSAAPPDVSGEIAAAVAGLPDGHRVTVVGCGARVPTSRCAYTLIDFDRDVLAAADPDGSGTHAVGMRTGRPDASADTVLITSRMRGLWPRWETLLREEAGRVGADIRVLF